MNKKLTIILIIGAVLVAALAYLKMAPQGALVKQDAPATSSNSGTLQDHLNTTQWKEYKTDDFSFRHSDSFKVTSVPNGDSEVITAEDDKFGFQMSIMPFDEAGPITKERILKDVPDMEINEPGRAKLDGVETLIFYGANEDIGETFEAWLTYKGNLYQIMTGREEEKLLEKILDTWKWVK